MNFGGGELALAANNSYSVLGFAMNDQISSVKVPQGCSLTVYSHEGLDGRNRVLKCLQEITEVFGRECLPLELPVNHAAQVVEVYDHESGAADFSSVDAAHTALIEQVVEANEAAMEHYLEEGAVPADELHAAFVQALRENHSTSRSHRPCRVIFVLSPKSTRSNRIASCMSGTKTTALKCPG
jgi:hypothetical protein